MLNWILAAAALATAMFGGLARRITFRGGQVVDSDSNPRMFWMLVGALAFAGLALLIEAVLNVR